MRICVIAKPGHSDSGVGRYTASLVGALRDLGHEVVLVPPAVLVPGWLACIVRRTWGWDLESFLQNYPVWARYPRADMYHISSQNLATLMLFRRPPGPTVITVHDILPHLNRGDRVVSGLRRSPDALMNRIAMWGLTQGTSLLAVSTYTRDCLVEQFGLPPELITVTLEGVQMVEENRMEREHSVHVEQVTP